jgi:hypothetical protein
MEVSKGEDGTTKDCVAARVRAGRPFELFFALLGCFIMRKTLYGSFCEGGRLHFVSSETSWHPPPTQLNWGHGFG